MVEGARLLSEYTVKSCIEGSNPFLSATSATDNGADLEPIVPNRIVSIELSQFGP